MDKMKDIKLIALDLDGTTLADSDTLSKLPLNLRSKAE